MTIISERLKITLAKVYMTIAANLLLFINTATAAGKNDEAMQGMVASAKSIFGGSFLQIALNAGGIGAIIFSIMGGFRVGPFIGGLGLLVFNALYFGYLDKLFS